jgi:ribosome maturation factor RimP
MLLAGARALTRTVRQVARGLGGSVARPRPLLATPAPRSAIRGVVLTTPSSSSSSSSSRAASSPPPAAAARQAPPPPPAADDDEDEGTGEEPPEGAAATAAGISTGGVGWGEAAAAAAAAVLSADPALAGLALWSLATDARAARLSIRLDKPGDPFGSPSLDEVAAFAAAFGRAFEEGAGAEVAAGVEVEVSSPGAERTLRVPGDLPRFADLPMAVTLSDAATAAALSGGCGAPKGGPPRPSGSPFLFSLVQVDEAAGTVEWRPADVRANRGPTGRLTKAQKDVRVCVGVEAVLGVRLWLDV